MALSTIIKNVYTFCDPSTNTYVAIKVSLPKTRQLELLLTLLMALSLHFVNTFQKLYRSDTVNSKFFVGKILLRIAWKFEL